VDGNLVVARRRPPVTVRPDHGEATTVDYGEVGDVETVNPEVILTLLDRGFVPVVASLASDGDGRTLNINADTLAEAIAVALGAKKLILLTTSPGLLRDANDPTSLVPFADPHDLEALLASGNISGGMRPKLEACIRAVRGGVLRTHIIDGRAPDSILMEVFTGAGCGTMIVNEKEKSTYQEREL
jgi:acetylglutamate kinase